jgi:hypothetical protein
LSLGDRSHVFYIFKGKGVTVKEGYNMLSGRAVYKQRLAKNGQKYNDWIDLDLSVREDNGYKIVVYPESHGFDIGKAVEDLQISTPTVNWDRSMLLRSLEKGNLQAAFVREDGKQRKVLIQANPKKRSIAIREIEPVAWTKMEEGKTGDDIEEALSPKNSKSKKLKDIAGKIQS